MLKSHFFDNNPEDPAPKPTDPKDPKEKDLPEPPAPSDPNPKSPSTPYEIRDPTELPPGTKKLLISVL